MAEESIERLKVKLSFYKFCIGTVGLGLVTALLDASYKDRAIALEEQKHLSTFVETAVLKDVGPRLRMAQYFADVTRSKDLRIGWEAYLDRLRLEVEEINLEQDVRFVEIDSAKDEVERILANGDSLSREQERRIEQLDREIAGREERIEALRKKLSVNPYEPPILISIAPILGPSSDPMPTKKNREYWRRKIKEGSKKVSGASLRDENFTEMDLDDLLFHFSVLTNADFTGASLVRARFNDSRIDGALLVDTDLTDARFAGTNVHRANFQGAILTGADFATAKGLKQNQLDSACVNPSHPAIIPDELTQPPPCSIAR